MSGREQMELLYQLIPLIQKLDTTRVILRMEPGFTEEELEKVQEVVSLVKEKGSEMMKNAKERT